MGGKASTKGKAQLELCLTASAADPTARLARWQYSDSNDRLCVSGKIDIDATLSTLRYASTARQIRNKPTKNITVDDSAAQIQALQHQVTELEALLAKATEMAVRHQSQRTTSAERLRRRSWGAAGRSRAERAQHKAAQAEWEDWRLEQIAGTQIAERAANSNPCGGDQESRSRVVFEVGKFSRRPNRWRMMREETCALQPDRVRAP